MSIEIEKSLVEGNKIIADFMNYPGNDERSIYYYAMKHAYDNNNMRYHNSWDWLHGAWDKFSKIQLKEVLKDEDEGFNDTYGRHLIAISNAIIHYNIEVAHYRLVRAIDWYNNQSKQQSPIAV